MDSSDDDMGDFPTLTETMEIIEHYDNRVKPKKPEPSLTVMQKISDLMLYIKNIFIKPVYI